MGDARGGCVHNTRQVGLSKLCRRLCPLEESNTREDGLRVAGRGLYTLMTIESSPISQVVSSAW